MMNATLVYRLLMVLIVVFVAAGLLHSSAEAQTVITKQSFESSEEAPAWNYAGSITRVGFVSFGTSLSLMASDGNSGWDITNSTQSILLDNQSTLGYKSVSFILDLASGDKGSPYNGYPDADDSVIVVVSTNNGSSWSREVVLVGPSNTYFGYFGVSASWDGNNVPTVFSGSHGQVTLSLPDSIHQYRVQITAKTNTVHDSWWLDYPRLVGTPVDPNGMQVSSINDGVVPSAAEPFSITVQSKNLANLVVPVVQNTPIHVSLTSGTGVLSGTVNGQIDAGSSSTTISGLVYSKAESGVNLTVSATGGDALSSTTTGPFTVTSGAQTAVFVGLPSTGVKSTPIPFFTIEARRPDNSVDTNYDNYQITISKATGPGGVTGTLTAQTSKGIATFSGVVIDSEGTYTLHATGLLLTTGTSSSIVISKVTPTVDTTFADNIGADYASVHAFVNLQGGEFTRYFEFGHTAAYGSNTAAQTVSGSGYYLNLNAASSQYATLDDNDSLHLEESGQYTIEAWVKFNSFTWLGGIVGKYQSGGSNGFVLRLLGDGDYRGLDFDGMTTADDILNADQWYHIAAVNDGGTRHLYIDGVEQALNGSSWTVEWNYDPISIGADYLDSPRFLDGSVDEVRIWSVARSQAEILATKDFTISEATKGLVLSVTFDDATIGDVVDHMQGGSVYFNNDPTRTSNNRARDIGEDLTDLDNLQQYHYRIVLKSGGDYTYGPDKTFTTLHGYSYGGGAAENGGYYYANSTPSASSAPSQPSYAWVTETSHEFTVDDLTGGTDDGIWPAVTMPFLFPFFSNQYDHLNFSTNGLLTFGGGNSAYDNTAIPDNDQATNFIALTWDDFKYVDGFTRVFYGGDVNHFVVTYDSLVSLHDDTQWVTAQVILYSDGRIKMQFSDDGSSDSSGYVDVNTIGIEDSTGTLGVQYRYNGSGGRMFGSNLAVMFGKDVAALPIQLSTFNAVSAANGAVHCEWTTLTETKNYGFYVQRRGQSDKAYTTISGLIAGAGSTIEEHTYAWDDAHVAAGTYFYRLKQVDLDGTVSYSQDLKVTVGVLGVNDDVAPREFSLKQNYPNPFNPTTSIKFSVEKNEHASVSVYNLLGQEVARLFDGIAEAGRYYRLDFNASSLPSGVYMYRVVTDSKMDVKRMMLVK